MRRRTLLAAGLAVAGGAGAVVIDEPGGELVSPPDTAAETPDSATAETQIVDGINQLRADAGESRLDPGAELADAAREHSRDMAARDFYAHTNPDGEKPWERAPCRAGENLHRGRLGTIRNVDSTETWDTRDTDELAGYVVEGWELSEGHRQNMLDTGWSAVGVGVHVDEEEFFATALFC